MKYFRTKDTIYELLKTGFFKYEGLEERHTYYLTIDRRTFLDGQVLKQAETLEELCDEFVIGGTNWAQIIDLDSAKYNCNKHDNLKVYGAIWTDKGLIYIAKMNTKGELELL